MWFPWISRRAHNAILFDLRAARTETERLQGELAATAAERDKAREDAEAARTVARDAETARDAARAELPAQARVVVGRGARGRWRPEIYGPGDTHPRFVGSVKGWTTRDEAVDAATEIIRVSTIENKQEEAG